MVSAICHDLTSKVVFICQKNQKWYLGDIIDINMVIFLNHFLDKSTTSKTMHCVCKKRTKSSNEPTPYIVEHRFQTSVGSMHS
jgi:hypothetical protein